MKLFNHFTFIVFKMPRNIKIISDGISLRQDFLEDHVESKMYKLLINI